jgi:putative tributyrin esterase
MAYMQCSFFSQTLKSMTDIGVVIPSPEAGEAYFKPGVKFQTLYAFHGAYGGWSDWLVKSSMERYAQKLKLAVVMPGAGNSFYQDMSRGEKYLTFLTEELPVLAQTVFPLSPEREDNFTGGLSMGGYGALKVALAKPELFSCAISISGALDTAELFKDARRGEETEPFRLWDIFEDPNRLEGTDADIFHVIKTLKSEGRPLPKMFLSCGTEDFLYDVNIGARDKLKALGADVHFEEHPGTHDWDYFDTHMRRALDWLPKAGLCIIRGNMEYVKRPPGVIFRLFPNAFPVLTDILYRNRIGGAACVNTKRY